jgi:hypothetical protein
MRIQVLFSAALLTILYNMFVAGHPVGLGLSFFIIALNIYLFLLKDSRSGAVRGGVFFSLVSSIFALVFAYSANSIVQVISLFTAVGTLGIAGYLYKSENKFPYSEKIIAYPILLLLRSVAAVSAVFTTSQSLLGKGEQERSKSTAVLRGLLVALPIVVVLLGILNSADPIFNSLLIETFSGIGERAVTSLIVFCGAILLAFAVVKPSSEEPTSKPQEKKYTIELGVVIGSVGVIFAAFILVQLRYLFSAVDERTLVELGISSATFSEYVRKGFFELLAAALIAATVLIGILKYLRTSIATKSVNLLRYVGAVVSLETLIILASAVKRLSLYADAHGLTRARIFGFIFLVWLAGLLILFMLQLLNKLKAQQLFVAITATTLLALFSISVINIDKIIALRYPPTVNQEVDYYYIAKLSPDAVEGWYRAILDAEQVIASLEEKAILTADDNRKLFYIENALVFIQRDVWSLSVNQPWQSTNLAVRNAQVFIKQTSSFENIPDLQDRVNRLQMRVSQEAQQSTQLDRAIDQPLSE